MNRTVLIIDDDQNQALQLNKALAKSLPLSEIEYASDRKSILEKIENFYYSVAIVDLRMDGLSIDGFDIIDRISVINPYAKIIAISAFTKEYMEKLQQYYSNNKILAVSEKEEFEIWVPKLTNIILSYFNAGINNITVQSLIDLYSDAKNQKENYFKGVKFENFVTILFRQMGFKEIRARVRDEALNEKDLIVRNDIDDVFFSKFKRYIYVECKNKPNEGFSKNDFILFNSKINSSSGDSDFGVVFTTGHIKSTVPKEALKNSKENIKIVYLSQPEIEKLIHASNMLEEFKCIIDSQVN